MWFEVIQTMQDPLLDAEGTFLSSWSELSESFSSSSDVKSFLSERKERTIQLSSQVLVGPNDTKLEKPIKIKIPHCLPYRNTSWNLHLQARGQNCESDDWVDLSNSTGLVISPSQQRQKVFKVRGNTYMCVCLIAICGSCEYYDTACILIGKISTLT